MKNIVLAAGLAMIVVILARHSAPTPATIGKMPQFNLVKINGGNLKSDELRGNVLVLDFWASWCDPCKSEIPKYNKLAESMAGKDFRMIGYAVESGSLDEVRKSAGKLGIQYQVVMGDDTATEAFGYNALPTTFLIGKDGKIYKKYVGTSDGKMEQMTKDVVELLNVPYTPAAESAPVQSTLIK